MAASSSSSSSALYHRGTGHAWLVVVIMEVVLWPHHCHIIIMSPWHWPRLAHHPHCRGAVAATLLCRSHPRRRHCRVEAGQGGGGVSVIVPLVIVSLLLSPLSPSLCRHGIGHMHLVVVIFIMFVGCGGSGHACHISVVVVILS